MTLSTRILTSAFLLAAVTFGLGCDEDPAVTAELASELGETTADPAAAGLVPLTDAPVPSIALNGSSIRVWVSPEAELGYAAIRPDTHGSGSTVPAGSVIVREVYDDSMTLTKRTVIARRGDPEALGGWVFGVYDVDGAVMLDDQGAQQFGLMTNCAGCHSARADDDFLFGLPR